MAQTTTGADPFAGAPGSNQPAPSATDPSAVAAATGAPTFTVSGSGSKKTFGGIPTSDQTGPLSVQQTHVPGLSPEDQGPMGASTIPAYKDGDQYALVDSADPDVVRNLQIQMIQAGLITVKKVHLGLWDAYSANAYAKVLAYANTIHRDASTALDNYVESSLSLPQNQLSGSDLEAVGNNAAQAILGRDLTATELSQFSAAFQSAIATQPPTTQPGTDQLAQNLVKSENPTGAKQYGLNAVAQKAMQVLTNPAVSLPAVQ